MILNQHIISGKNEKALKEQKKEDNSTPIIRFLIITSCAALVSFIIFITLGASKTSLKLCLHKQMLQLDNIQNNGCVV